MAVNLFSRLIRYLALDQITEAHKAGYMECAAIAELAKLVCYEQGVLDGRKEMGDAIDRTVAERTMGMGDYISAEDLASAKKGMVH